MASKIKQVIVMQTGTNPAMRKGKMIAQGSHASLAFFVNKFKNASSKEDNLNSLLNMKQHEIDWIESNFPKICLKVDSEQELLDLYNKAKLDPTLEVHLITDDGLTEFKEPTITCLAIGPDLSEKIDLITGHLKML